MPQQAEINTKLNDVQENLSKQRKFIDNVLLTTLHLGDLWRKWNFRERQKNQNLVYPQGILYNKELECYRINFVNPALEIFRKFTDSYKFMNKKRT